MTRKDLQMKPQTENSTNERNIRISMVKNNTIKLLEESSKAFNYVLCLSAQKPQWASGKVLYSISEYQLEVRSS